MKKLACIFLIVIVTITCCSCGIADTEAEPTAKLSERFVVIDDDLNNYAPDFTGDAFYVRKTNSFYVVDRYSLAVYLYVYDGGSSSGADFIPLFDKDGTILTYDGTLPE